MTIDEAITILTYHKCPDSNGMDCGKYTCKECHEATDMAISALEHQKWIPFVQEHDDKENCYNLLGSLPLDGQEILITVNKSGHLPVQFDTFIRDGNECYLDSGYDLATEATAWMPLPDPYREEQK